MDKETKTAKPIQRRKAAKDKPKPDIRNRQNIPPFAEIMSRVDESGYYTQVEPIEVRKLDATKLSHVSQRNYLKNQALALMMFGFSTTETSHLLGLPPSTISTWRAKATTEQLKKIEESELKIVQNRVANALNTCLGSAERIALFVSEREFIQKQDPEKIERLFNMVVGFSTKLIESKQRMDIAKRQVEVDRGFSFTPVATSEDKTVQPS